MSLSTKPSYDRFIDYAKGDFQACVRYSTLEGVKGEKIFKFPKQATDFALMQKPLCSEVTLRFDWVKREVRGTWATVVFSSRSGGTLIKSFEDYGTVEPHYWVSDKTSDQAMDLTKFAKGRKYEKNYSEKFTTESGGTVRVYDSAHIKQRWKEKEKVATVTKVPLAKGCLA